MRILYILLSIIFLSCNNGESKLVRKKIENGDVTIKWYYYSYITSTIPDFIEIERDKSKVEIYKAKMVIVDLVLKEKNIILKLTEPSKGKSFYQKCTTTNF